MFWLTTETIMPLTRKEKWLAVLFDQLVGSGQKLSLRVISGSGGACHPSTL